MQLPFISSLNFYVSICSTLIPGEVILRASLFRFFSQWYAIGRHLARASKSSLRLDMSGGAGTGA